MSRHVNYPASSNLTAAELSANSDTLANVRLWDPTQTQPTYDKLQDIRSYYQFNTLAIDRYKVNGVETPVDRRRPRDQRRRPPVLLVGQHHAAVHPRLRDDHLAGQHGHQQRRSRVRGGRRAARAPTAGCPTITQPSVYFGLNNAGYVVANTKQPEIDYQLTNGTNDETHYTGDGGVQLSNFFDQAMFAIRFSDFNLIISNQITSQSRLMFDRGVQARVTKAAPFLSLDADPYPVLLNGQIDWVQDAYTTTDNYPYAQNADTSAAARAAAGSTRTSTTSATR